MFMYLGSVCVCMGARVRILVYRVLGSENDLQESVFSFCCVGSRVIRLGRNYLHHMSRLTGPKLTKFMTAGL